MKGPPSQKVESDITLGIHRDISARPEENHSLGIGIQPEGEKHTMDTHRGAYGSHTDFDTRSDPLSQKAESDITLGIHRDISARPKENHSSGICIQPGGEKHMMDTHRGAYGSHPDPPTPSDTSIPHQDQGRLLGIHQDAPAPSDSSTQSSDRAAHGIRRMSTPDPEPEEVSLTSLVTPAILLDVDNLYYQEAQRQISQQTRPSPPTFPRADLSSVPPRSDLDSVPPPGDQSSPEVVTQATSHRLITPTAPLVDTSDADISLRLLK